MSNAPTSIASEPEAGGDILASAASMIANELERRGFDYRSLLAEQGLAADTLRDPIGRYPRRAYLRFVERALATSGDAALHVHAATRAELGLFRLVDFIGVMSPTVGIGLRTVLQKFDFVDTGVRFVLHEAPTRIVCELHGVAEPHPSDYEAAAIFVVIERRVRVMTAETCSLAAIDLRAADGPVGEALRRCLPTTMIRFGQPRDRMIIAREAWEATPEFAHPAVGALVLGRSAPSTPGDWHAQVEDVIREDLADGNAAAPAVAARLGMSERSLQRRLHERGTTFVAMLEQVRQTEAFRLLRGGTLRLGIAEIARRLGYSETSAFTRAFRRWTGSSPSAWLAKK